MKLDQFFLLKLMEECAEVSQRASKTIQFGWDEIQPGQDKTNRERLQGEVYDLLCLAALLKLDISWDEEIFNKKKDKLLKYLKYSKDIGAMKVD